MRFAFTNAFGGKIVRDDENYRVEDHDFLPNLTLSRTTLYAGKSTRGHKHPDCNIDEVYYFVSGHGYMEIDHMKYLVAPHLIMQIKGNEFHRVFNDTKEPLVFLSIFNRYERSK
jgi:mannose-6-phosphate isomerase-like protein (cupin superfamily)